MTGGLNVGAVVAKFTADVTDLKRGVSEAKSQVATLGTSFRNVGGNVQSFFSTAGQQAQTLSKYMTAFGAVGVGVLGMVGKAGVSAAADFEQTRIALTTMMGSAEDAGNLLQDISKFAASTPFEFPELATTTKQLMAFGFSANDAMQGMKTLGDISAGLNVPIGDLAYLLGTLKAQGRAMTIDIRQFAMRGLPIYDALAATMKVSKEEISGLVEAGKVGFPEVNAALESMVAEGGKFHGSMANQATSLKGLYSTLRDVMGFTLREIIGINLKGEVREGSIFDILRIKVASLIAFLDANKENIANFFSRVIEGIQNIGQSQGFQTMLAIMRTLGDWIMANKENILTFLGGAGAALAVFMGFGAIAGILTTILSPLGLILIACGSLAVGVKWLNDNWQDHIVAISLIGSILTVTLLPALIALGVQMGVTLVKQVVEATTKFVLFIIENWAAVASTVAQTVALTAQVAVWLAHKIALVASTVASAAMTTATWALNAAIFLLTTPIGLVVLAIAALIAIGVLLYKNWDVVKDKAADAGDFIVSVFNKMKDGAGNALNGLYDMTIGKLEDIWNKAKEYAEKIRHAISDAFDKDKHNSPSISDKVQDLRRYVESNQFGFTPNVVPQGASTINQTINAQVGDGVGIDLLGARLAFLMRSQQ